MFAPKHATAALGLAVWLGFGCGQVRSAGPHTSEEASSASGTEASEGTSGGCPQSGRQVYLRTRDVLTNDGLATHVDMSFDIDGGSHCLFPANCLNFTLWTELPVGRSVVGSYGGPESIGSLDRESGTGDHEMCHFDASTLYEMEITAYDEDTGCYAGRMISVDNPLFEPIVGDFWGYTGCAG